MSSRPRRGPAVIAVLVVVAGIAAWQAPPLPSPPNPPLGAEPRGIMGTTCRLVAVPPSDASAHAARDLTARAVREAEAALRAVEAEMSRWIDGSPLARLNRAPAGQRVPLPPATLAVLRASAEAYTATDGAFAVTSGPLIDLWRAAGEQQRTPRAEAIAAARAASSFSDLVLGPDGVTKRRAELRFDLGGIAKGYAIDRASERMIAAGAAGGLVDVGGDLRVFGAPAQGDRWEVQVRNPFGGDTITTLRVGPSAVCTSGNYFRFVEIEGRRYGHIIDPRTGYPTAGVHSATVVAPDAMRADLWATALAVLGEAGLDLLPADHEALLVLGDPRAPRAVATRGMVPQISTPLPYPLAVPRPRSR